MKIITNNQPRNLLSWYELTNKERSNFDYLETTNDKPSLSFFRYKGNVYYLGDFTTVPEESPLNLWHGYASDSFFSGVVVRFMDNLSDQILVGTYIS